MHELERPDQHGAARAVFSACSWKRNHLSATPTSEFGRIQGDHVLLRILSERHRRGCGELRFPGASAREIQAAVFNAHAGGRTVVTRNPSQMAIVQQVPQRFMNRGTETEALELRLQPRRCVYRVGRCCIRMDIGRFATFLDRGCEEAACIRAVRPESSRVP